MKTKLFILKGINPPGRVDIFKHGQVVLTEIDDEKALQLYREGNCPYLEPTEEGLKILHPEKEVIAANEIATSTQAEESLADLKNSIIKNKKQSLQLLAQTDDISKLDYSDQMIPMIKFLEIKTDNKEKDTYVNALIDFKASI